MRIEEKFAELSPAGQNAVMAFIEFLLSREEGKQGNQDEEDVCDDFSKETPFQDNPIPDNEVHRHQEPEENSGIILAEERIIDEKESIIDFADINTRFSKQDTGKEKQGPVRQRKMLDWL